MITQDDFTRITNDVNGNPRYIIYADWISDVKKKALGFKVYRGNRLYYVIQSYNIDHLALMCNV